MAIVPVLRYAAVDLLVNTFEWNEILEYSSLLKVYLKPVPTITQRTDQTGITSIYNIRSDSQCSRPQQDTFSSDWAAWFHRYQSSNVYAIFSTICAIHAPQTKQIKMASEITFLGDELIPFLSPLSLCKAKSLVILPLSMRCISRYEALGKFREHSRNVATRSPIIWNSTRDLREVAGAHVNLWLWRWRNFVLIAKFVASRCAFCKLQRNFGFFCSVNHLRGPFRKHTFTCDWCISIHSVCSCVSRFVWFVACNRPVSGNNWLVFFEDFSDLSYSCLLQE